MIKKINFIFISLFIIFVFFIFEVITNNILIYDNAIYNFIINTFQSNSMTNILKFITQFGSVLYFSIFSFLLVVLARRKKTKLLIPINICLVTLINIIIKEIIKRPRPSVTRLVAESGYSFPSGHAMTSIAFYGFLIYLIYKNIENKYYKWGLIILFSLLTFVIGFSRIYLGVHYTSDVISGFIAGAIYLILFIKFTK